MEYARVADLRRFCNAWQIRRSIWIVHLGLMVLPGCAGAPSPPLAKEPATQLSCAAEIGVPAASKLVKQCIQVSPATHPPCNAQNSCAMVRDEIKRACDHISDGKPSFCSQ